MGATAGRCGKHLGSSDQSSELYHWLNQSGTALPAARSSVMLAVAGWSKGSKVETSRCMRYLPDARNVRRVGQHTQLGSGESVAAVQGQRRRGNGGGNGGGTAAGRATGRDRGRQGGWRRSGL
eukprot:scaffold68756_cov41-Phaeocystis_antarctica.AAC.3